MPFAKRVVEPQFLCRYHIPNTEGVLFDDLFCVNNLALSRSLRQLSDMAQHACSIFKELESELLSNSLRLRGLQSKLNRLQETCSRLDYQLELVPESSLDIECKVKSHYQITYHHPKKIFQPSSRPTCVDELYRQASFGLWMLHSDHQRRQSGSSEQIATVPRIPKYPAANRRKHRASNLTMLESIDTFFPTKCCRFSPWSKKDALCDSDTDGVALGLCSKFPIPNTPSTLDKQTNWTKALPLPTPAERMKSNSQVIISSVIPINVTGLTFDRDATLHCSVINSKPMLQRRRTLRRRKMDTCHLQDFDFDFSPGPKEQRVNIYTSSDFVPCNEEPAGHHSNRDSCCQTEDFLISGAPSLNLLGSERVPAGCANLSYSAVNIPLLPYSPNAMFTASPSPGLCTGSLSLDASWVSDEEKTKERSTFRKEASPSAHETLVQKENEESTSEEAACENRRGPKYQQVSDCPEQSWVKRPKLEFTADLEIGEISTGTMISSSPVYLVSPAPSVLEGAIDNRDDHQSSSGNWSGSSSTCPSQTSETVPPAASSSLTSSCQSDSELSLISPTHANDDSADLVLDHYPDPRAQRSGSFSSTVTDVLESAGIETAVEQEWSNSHVGHSRSERLSPDKVENILACSSFTSIVTCESSLSDKTPSEKADTVSHCSVDTEGYYTSMHFDCGLRRSASYVYSDCTPSGPDFVLSDVGYSKTLGRSCLFLRKSKIKPYPPKRISSLTTICNLENHPDENEAKHFLPFLSAREEKPRLVSTSTTGQSEYSFLCRAPSAMRQWLLPDDPFESAVLSFSGQFKDKGVMQTSVSRSGLQFSDSSQPSLNSSADKTVDEHIRYQMTLVCQCDTAASPSPTDDGFKAISPTTPTTITSPSCGYSSDYPTHTSSFPLSFAPAPLSPPNGKSKPNVPERMSSLSSQSLQWQSIKKKDKTTTSDDGKTIMEYRKGIEMNTQNKQKIPNSCKVFSSTGIPVTLDSVMQRSLTDKCEKEMLTCTSASHLHFVSLDELGKALVSPVERFGQTRCEEDELESFEVYSLLSETAADIGEDSLRQNEVTCEESKTLKKQDACSTSAPLLSSDPIEGSAAKSKSEWVLMNKNNIEDDSEEDKHESSDDYAMKDSPSPESDAVSPLRDLSGTDDPPLSKIHSTEDLFTIIHRSKRKVLGPRDFNKLPATCPAFASGSRAIAGNMNGAARSLLPKMSSSSVTLPSLQKVPVPIYRNAKKSSTSKEDFKQLLLKKGSCSNSNYRMSATDILKSPVVHKSQRDVLSESPFLLQQPEEQSISPLQQNSGQIDFLPRSNADGYFPRSSPVFFSSGQGRSRILPPANSRHSARSRPYLALMQVISEGETENSDGSPHEENPSQGYS